MQIKISKKKDTNFCQEHEKDGTLPYLQANKLACLNFMDLGRKHKDSWDRDKDSLFLTAILTVVAISFVGGNIIKSNINRWTSRKYMHHI